MTRAARPQRGAALLVAMLTVALVASFSATAFWQQWQATEVETAERTRAQAAWLFTGTLDWARLILREDGRTGGADHLAEPWATALRETRLSNFLAADKTTSAASASSPSLEVFLSGEMQDMQSRMNVMNLVDASEVSEPDVLAFRRLFALLGLPPEELRTLTANLRAARNTTEKNAATGSPLLIPQRVEQLRWLGLSASSVMRLRPYVSVLPARTAVNLNTARAEVMYASIAGLELTNAQRLVDERTRSPFRNLEDAIRVAGSTTALISEGRHSVTTRFFEVHARLRMDKLVLQERSLLQRDGLEVKTLWREPMPLEEAAPTHKAAAAS